MAEGDRALVVALDRCLSPVDTRAEAALARWTGTGTAAADLPLDPVVLAKLRDRAAKGQRVYLMADASQPARELARHLGLFAGVVLRDAAAGQSARAAAERQVSGDVELWPAQSSTVRGATADLWRALRPHYWAKSLLVFLPLIAARDWADGSALAGAALAFVVMSLASSAIYVINDLVDLPDDRRDRFRQDRPIAAGRVGVRMAAGLALVCLGLALAGAGLIGAGLVLAVALYVGGALSYSLKLKSLRYVDVLWLSGLHTMRVIAGGIASGIPASGWLIALSLALFGSLASAKRVSELGLTDTDAHGPRPYGRGQKRGLLTVGLAAGIAAGGIVLAYAGGAQGQVHYPRPEWLGGVALCLVAWLARIWRAALTGHLGTDPILFALRDGVSWALAGILGLCLTLAAG